MKVSTQLCLLVLVAMVLCDVMMTQASVQTADTRIYKNGVMKSNARTTADALYRSDLHGDRRKRQTSFTGSRISQSEAQSLVDKHNLRRRNETSSNMEFMIWNPDLAAMAQEWADQCVWGHGQPPRSPDQLPFPQIGQNLYAYTGELSLERAMAAWSEDEKVFYNYDTLECEEFQQCGHYTQIVWATSNEVGCAYYRCPYLQNTGFNNAAYLVCNYGPAGNYRGEKPFKRGSSCTDCGNGKGWCDDGLCRNDCSAQGENCECKIQCHNCGTVTNDCECACSEGFHGTRCSERCVNTHPYCMANPGWPESWCRHEVESTAVYVREQCPAMCGQCTEFNQALHGPQENCPINSADPCFEISPDHCSGNGHVVHENGACVCRCNVGFRGDRCREVDINGPTEDTVTPSLPAQCSNWLREWCQNGGTVVFLDHLGYCGCACAPGFTDFYCDTEIAPGEPSTTRSVAPTTASTLAPTLVPSQCSTWNPDWCQNGGTVVFEGFCACACAPEWTGFYCDAQIQPTTPSTVGPTLLPPQCSTWNPAWCQNGGTVVVREGICSCACTAEWTGFYCGSPVTTTSTTTTSAPEPSTSSGSTLPELCRHWNPDWCANGGTVVVLEQGYCGCNCAPGFTAFYCDVAIEMPSSTEEPTSLTPTVLPPQCQGWSAAWCQNGGTVVFNEQTQGCGCACVQGWSGFYCGVQDNTAPPSSVTPSTPSTPSTPAPLSCAAQGWPSYICGSNGEVVQNLISGSCACECYAGWSGVYCTVRDTTTRSTTKQPPVLTTKRQSPSTRSPTTKSPSPSSRSPSTVSPSSTPEAVTQLDIGVLLYLEVQSQITWNSILNTIRPNLERDINSYCRANTQTCCDGADVTSGGWVDYDVYVGDGYPQGSESNLKALVYSKASGNNRCPFKELPQSVLYEIVKSQEQSLNTSVISCCGAMLSKVEQPEVTDSDGDDDDSGVPMWVFIVAGLAGLVLIIVLVTIAIVCVRKRKASSGNSYYNKEAGSRENLGYQT